MSCAENPGAFPECSAVSRDLPEGSGDLGKKTAKIISASFPKPQQMFKDNFCQWFVHI